MDNDGIEDMENYVQKFCVSYVTGEVAKVVFKRVVGAWTQHRIPGIVIILYIHFSSWLRSKNDDNGLIAIRKSKEHRDVYP